MPRAALLSIHARVEGTQPWTWEDPSLVQLWGPRFNVCSSSPAATGAVLIRWEGARRPTVLACRDLHMFGPPTPEAFTRWGSGEQQALRSPPCEPPDQPCPCSNAAAGGNRWLLA